MSALLLVFTIFQILTAGLLVFLVAIQTTKSEGLSGTIGGQSTSSIKVRKGSEDRLREYTKWAAVAFMVLSAIVALPMFAQTP